MTVAVAEVAVAIEVAAVVEAAVAVAEVAVAIEVAAVVEAAVAAAGMVSVEAGLEQTDAAPCGAVASDYLALVDALAH